MRRDANRVHRRLHRRRQIKIVIVTTMLAAAALVGMKACSDYFGSQGPRVGSILTDHMRA